MTRTTAIPNEPANYKRDAAIEQHLNENCLIDALNF